MSLTTFFNEPFYYTLSDFDRLFDEAFNARAPVVPRSQIENVAARPMRPKMDLHEDKEKNLVTAQFELPGLTKENVNIDLRDNVLTVSGEGAMSSEYDERGYAIRERRFGKFSRSLPVPPGIKPQDVQANMNHGVLTVTLPRSTPEQAPKKITIA
ncbi:small heat shock protein [Ganoderma leucocontextum]|nr:small heat shock protein [Ganoderma leucocontextum]